MNSAEYLAYFEEILNGRVTHDPYNNPDFLHYTKLNHSRQQRWFKTGELTYEMSMALSLINRKQKWILITEPWCGDAAHTVPFVIRMAEYQQNVELEIQLRDTVESLIDNYLTNGAKSIPILIVRDDQGNDLFTWGPRPMACQELHKKLIEENTDFDTLKTVLQKWYNDDRGNCLQREIAALLSDR